MKRPAVFFDRDNTLIISDGYLGDSNKVVLVGGAADAVARVRGLGFATVVFSNQSGVARGMFGEDAVHAVNAKMDEQLLDANPAAVIDRHEFCPFHPEAIVESYRQDSPLRKPRPGMIVQAAEKLALDLSRSWAIGDAPRDVEAGHAAGCRTILVKDATLPPSPAANSASDVDPDFVVNSLREAVDVIARETMGPVATEEATPGTEVATSPDGVHAAPETVTATVMRVAPAAPQPAASTAAARKAAPQASDPDAPLLPKRETHTPRVDPPRVETTPPTLKPPRHSGTAGAYPVPDAAPTTGATAPPSLGRLEELTEKLLAEVRRQNEPTVPDFSVSKLMAGIVQVIALAALFLAYFRQGDAQQATLLTALTLQCFTIALLIMGRQK
jgi:D-glycero-D-manno-heptose 1,7-bisphosphate phosphatase